MTSACHNVKEIQSRYWGEAIRLVPTLCVGMLSWDVLRPYTVALVVLVHT